MPRPAASGHPSAAASTGGLVAGFDVGGTNIRAEVLDGTGMPAAATAQRRACPETADGIVDVIAGMARDIEAEHRRDLAAVGVGCAGLVNRQGTVLTSPNIPGISGFPLRELLGERLGRPLAVENDATVALRAEMTFGAAAGVDDVLFATFGTGIGAALVADGAIRRGMGGLAGEAGHMIVAPDGPACPCGRSGCWERLASGGALARAGREAARAGRAPALLGRVDGRVDDLRGEHVGELAAAGDAVARSLLREVAAWVAIGLNNLILLLDPGVVVLGGGLSELGEVFLAPVREALEEVYVEQRRRPPVEIRAAHHGDRAGAIGAALLAADLAC